MLLSEIFESLNYSELATLTIGDNSDDGISPDNYKSVVNYINRGLIALYTRFNIDEKEINILLDENINKYELKPSRSISTGNAPDLYLMDSNNNPFNDRVLKINLVKFSELNSNKELQNKKIILNDETNKDYIVKELNHNTLYINKPVTGNIITVRYRAAPQKISNTITDPELVEVNLPYSLLDALTYYIGIKAHLATPPLDGQHNESSIYEQKYENSIAVVEANGLMNYDALSNTRLEDNGWR